MRFTVHTALAQTGSVRSPPCDVDAANVRKNPDTTFVSTCAVKFSAFSTMNDSQNLSHPEIEFRPSFLTYLPASSPPRETLLDLLEVYPDRINLKPKLNHSSLIDYFSVSICAFSPGALRADSMCRKKMQRSRTTLNLSEYCVLLLL